MHTNVAVTARALLAFTIGLGAITIDAPAVEAHATAGVPHHVASNVQCFTGTQGRTVRAFAASTMRSVTGAIEAVQWSSDLWYWTGSVWAPYDDSAGWLDAAANGNGLLGSNGVIWYGIGARQQNSWRYAGLPAGSYAIKQFYRWTYNGLQHPEWSGVYNNTAATYCALQ